MSEQAPKISFRVVRALRWLLVLITPALLALTAARIVMMGTWLIDFEYGRIPPDRYGFSTEERHEYAIDAMEYIRDGLPITHLIDLTTVGGPVLYTPREAQHMIDVQAVAQKAFTAQFVLMVAALAAAAYLLWKPETRPALWRAMFGGGVLTLVLIAALVVVGVVSWDLFFDTFHALFFEGGTWTFRYDDTLIRLFPEQFWFEAALIVGVMTAAGAGVLVAAGWRRRDIDTEGVS